MEVTSRSGPVFNRRTVLLVVLLVGTALSVWSFQDARAREREHAASEFARRSTIRHTLTREVLGRYEDALFGLAAVFMLEDEVDPDAFARAAGRIQGRTPGIQALEWVPLVPGAERAAREAALGRHYVPRVFEFTERDPAGRLRRAGVRSSYLPISYIEPLAGNEPALGYDLMTGPTRAHLDQARASGLLALTGQVPLVQEQAGLIMIAPVRRPARSGLPGSPPEFVGFVQAVFRTRDLLERTRMAHPDTIFDMLFLDSSEPDPARRVLYYRPAENTTPRESVPTEAEFRRGVCQELSIPIGGRDWRVLYRPRAGWIEEQFTPLPWVRTGGVLVITLLLAGLVRILGRRTEQIEREVVERTTELAENRRELDSILRALPGAAFRCTFDDKLTALFVSEGMLALTGYPPDDFISGRRHITQLTVPADRSAARAALTRATEERRSFEVEYRFTHRDGQEKWVLVRGRPIHDASGGLRFLEGLAIDITALKRAEQERMSIERRLLEGQKLESLGVMAGGIAHDFNNILTSVLGNASLARQLAVGPASGHLEQIEKAARRAADLCQQLLAYTGKGKLVTERVDLSEVVRSTASLLEVTISKNTRLELQLANGLPLVLADVTQLRQIVMNLVINAADAIGEAPGRITVGTHACAAGADLLQQALGRPELPAGHYVGLVVNDTGCGMSPEIIARIFEPFFSTKFSGRGLGLAAVQGIVQNHQGALFVESQPGAGSTFRLLLPAMEGPAKASAPAFADTSGPVRLNGVVLVVDDEETVRGIVTAVLESFGATVLPASGGEEALALLSAHGDRVTLVLLDLTMPGISGEETLRRFRLGGARPPVIIMSGYSETEIMKRSTDLGVAGFIQKPFEIATLLERVKPHFG
ncbi:MAG: CHASE domain-containing protein [Opitutae bacterium]|nr:CHASE domain-containing protein [Opitutae bacterium]